MLLVKIMKRKDAASVLVAIVLAMIIVQPITSCTIRIAGWITSTGGQSYGPTGDWKVEYLNPIVWALVQILVFEALAWAYVYVARMAKNMR